MSVDIHLKQAATHFSSVFANIFQYSCHHHHSAHFQNKAALQDSVKEKSLAMIFQQLFPVGWKYLSSSFLGVLVFCCCCFSPPATHCIFRSLALPQSIKQVSEWIHILISFGYIFAYFSFLFLFLLFCNLVIFCVFSLVIFGHLEKKSQETFFSCTSSMTLRYTTRAQTGRQTSLGHTTLPFSSVSGRCGTCYWCSLNF